MNKMNQVESRISFVDETEDRKYFSIVPNYIINHSTLEERGFYLTLKRIAGENNDGRIYYSARELGEMCGVKKDKIYQLLNSLLRRKWIKEAGIIPAKTKPRMTYSIVDLWKKNIEFYSKKIVGVDRQSSVESKKIVGVDRQRSSVLADTKEELYKEDIELLRNNSCMFEANILDKQKKIDIVLSHFNNLFQRTYRPTAGRERKLQLRLKTFSLEQILQAVTTLSQSPWHKGENDRGWVANPDFILRSDEQIDKWLQQQTVSKEPFYTPEEQKAVDEAKEKMKIMGLI